MNAFLINTGNRLILVDAGTGSYFGPTLGKLADDLRAAGYQPEQVDDVLLTHMHPDHIDGLASDGAMLFPNAIVHASKPEADNWLSAANLESAPQDAKAFFQDATASVNPYAQHGRLQLVAESVEVVPGIHSYPSAGHTVGHTSYVVDSKGQKLFLVGDLLSVPAVQLEHHEINMIYDADDKTSVLSRLEMFKEASQTTCWSARRTYLSLGSDT